MEAFGFVSTYGFDRIPVDDRLDVYANDMLLDARCSAVESAILSFVIAGIEPVGWRAVWRSTPASSGLDNPCNFTVNVEDVSRCKLEATIRNVKLFVGFKELLDRDHEDIIVAEKIDTAINLFEGRTLQVPLLELYPIYDESTAEQFLYTAEIIEHVRFFYKYLWYAWDAEDEDDCIFTRRYLKPRMKLFEDIENGFLSIQDVGRYHSILDEAKEIHLKLEVLEVDMGASDLEVDLDENDVLSCMELRKRQEELKRQLQYMESPALRSLLFKKENSVKTSAFGKRPGGEVVTHIVAAKLLAGMCSSLHSSVVIEHHTSLASATATAHDGDSIYIYDGVYVCETLSWLDDSISIEGKGASPQDVVLECDGCGDIFINCSAPDVRISNLTVRNTDDRRYVIMIHGGHTVLDRCFVEFGDSLVGICVNPGAELTINGCRLGPAKGCAVDVQLSGKADSREVAYEDCTICIAHQYDEKRKSADEVASDIGEICTFSRNENRDIWYPSSHDIHLVLSGILDDVDSVATQTEIIWFPLERGNFEEPNPYKNKVKS